MIEFSHEVNLHYNNIVLALSSLLAAVEEPTTKTGPRSKSLFQDESETFSALVHVRREVLSACKFFETFITALSDDLKQKNFLLPVMIPSARSVPFPQEHAIYVTPPKPSQNLLKRLTVPTRSVVAALPPVHDPTSLFRQEGAVGRPTVGPSASSSRLQHPTSISVSNDPSPEREIDLSERIVCAGLYVAFDALARLVHARDGHVALIRNFEEAQGVCVYGEKYRLAPELKIPLKSGPVGVVIRSGIAANIMPPTPTADSPNQLCVPIRPGKERHIAPIGCVTLTRLGDAFSRDEESLVFSWAIFAQQILTGYGVDHMKLGFDPIHTLLKPTSNVYLHLRQSLAQREREDIVGIIKERNLLSDATSKHIAEQQPADLIFRNSKPSEFIAVRGGRHISGPADNLEHLTFGDIAEYVQQLEKCWTKAQSNLHGIEEEQIMQLDEVRKGRRKAKEAMKKARDLEDRSEMYQQKFEALKSELAAVCGKKLDPHPPDWQK